MIAGLVTALLLAGCGGGGSSSGGNAGSIPAPVASTSSGPSTQSAAEIAVTDTNAVGAPLTSFSTANVSITPLSLSREPLAVGDGSCKNDSEFFVPDTMGDPHSTERKEFFDSGCTLLARDVVRIFTSTGTNSESVAQTVNLYAANNATPIATRTATDTIDNATFDTNGYPSVAAGFQRVNTSTLAIGSVKTIAADNELVMEPGTNGVNSFCGDSAHYNATGLAALNETFGSQGILTNGTRTANADGTVTWSSTHTGNGEKGAIGALSIATGTPNTACPIATPDFTIAGGTATGSYSIPVTAIYSGGTLINLTITNATLANGSTLNVSTNAGVSPSSNLYITGTIAKNGATTATFATDAFGDGTLTVTSTGNQFVITDWHVIK